MTVVLGQSGNGNVQPQFVLDHLANHFHLSASTVGNDEVGQGSPLFLQPRIPTHHHFLHRGVVIGPHHGFDVVFSIFFFTRFQPFEHHAGRHGILAADVRVVEQFDVNRQSRQAQIVLDFRHEACGFLLRVELFSLLQTVELVLLHVQFRKVEKLLLVAPQRNGLFGHFIGNVDVKRHHNFARGAAVAVAHFNDAQGKQFLVRFIEPLFVLKGKGLVNAAILYVQIVDESQFLVGFDVEHVDVVQHGRHHLAFGAEILDEFVALLHLLRLLKA